MNDKTKRTVRTVLQALFSVAVSLPVLLDATGLKPSDVPWLATIVAGCAVFARIMASEPVEDILQRFFGGRLAIGSAAPAPVPVAPAATEQDPGTDGA